jgi:hypothetical protein
LPTNDLGRATPTSVRRVSIAAISPSIHQHHDTQPSRPLPSIEESTASDGDKPPPMQPHFKVKRRLVVTVEDVRDLQSPLSLIDASNCAVSLSLCVTSARISPELRGSIAQHMAIASRVASLPLEARLLLKVSCDDDSERVSGWLTFTLFDHRDCLRLGRHVLHAWNETVPSRCLNTSSNVAAFGQTLQVTLNISIGHDDAVVHRDRATQWQRQSLNPPDTIPAVRFVSLPLLKVCGDCLPVSIVAISLTIVTHLSWRPRALSKQLATKIEAKFGKT